MVGPIDFDREKTKKLSYFLKHFAKHQSWKQILNEPRYIFR